MAIVIKNLSKSFEGKKVINNLNLTINDKETAVIIGPSGIGKTVLLNILLGIITPNEGYLTDLSSQKLGVVFQDERLIENLSVSANLNLVLQKPLTKVQISKECEKLGLNLCGNELISSLSGGMKRRISILRAIIVDPDILFLDEPFSGLDEKTAELTANFIFNSCNNRTIFAITHNVSLFSKFNPVIVDLEKL